MKIIPTGAQNWVSNPRTAEFVENTFFAVSVETALKMIGRPTFIMMDKQADSKEKKKYAATKEMLYQGLCLGLYLTFLPKIKHFFYDKITNFLKNKSPENKANIDEFNRQNKLIEDKYKEMKKSLKEVQDKIKKKNIKNKALEEIIKLKENLSANKNMHLGKGAKEAAAIMGSILMLTIVAPQISHFIIHPIMNMLGFDKNENAKH